MPNYDMPSKTTSRDAKRDWLLDKCKLYINKFVLNTKDINDLVQETHELELSSLGKYECREPNCDKVYVYHSARVR